MTTDIRLSLGPVGFASFEVPERVEFGGRQRLSVHQLSGGVRVVDAMGRDDAQVVWAGVFSGPDAADRMRILDALRVTGSPLPLSWDAFFYTVVIAELHADYSTPWWIPYRLACTVVQDEATGATVSMISLAAAITDDLTQAASYVDVSAAQAALGADGATTRGAAGYTAAVGALQQAGSGIDAQIATAGVGLSAADLPTLVSSAGALAQLGAARGYVMRAEVNLANAST